jgi:ribosome maturation factor RimP
VATSEALRDLLEPLLGADGLELVDAQVGPGLVRVLVDRPGGIDLEAVSQATERVSAALDAADPIPGRYTLEVSSPGIERPLRTPDHFARAVGSVVAVKTTPAHEGERRLEGRLLSAAEDGITLAVPESGELRLAYADIEKARTVFEWPGEPKPSSPSRQKKSSRPSPKQKKAPQ